MTRKSVLKCLEDKSLPPSSKKVVDALFEFLGYSQSHDRQNFVHKVSSGMINFGTHLKNLDLKKISSGNYFKARRSLRSINEKSLESENEVAHAVFIWLWDVVELDTSSSSHHAEEGKKEETHQAHQSENQSRPEYSYSNDSPVIREEATSGSLKSFDNYLKPTLMKDESSESPVKHQLAKDESTISQGNGLHDWGSLGNR